MKVTARRLRFVFNLWPPFFFAGIRVREIARDWSYARVELVRRWYNQNYVGTHFGGSLFAMTDPFWMILVLEQLGRDYIVWDKAGEIDFIAAKKEPVHAEFRVTPDLVQRLRDATPNPGDRTLEWLVTDVKTGSGELVARVRKQIYVRRKH